MPSSFLKVVAILMLWALVPVATGAMFWILLLLAAAATIYFVSRLRYLYGAPWRRLYFPMFREYLRDTMVTGSSHSPEERLTRLMPVFLPSVDPGQAKVLVSTWSASFADFLDDSFYKELILAHGGNQSSSEKLAVFRTWLEKPANRNSYFVRYVFGNVIERHAGEDQKRQFWEAVLANKLP